MKLVNLTPHPITLRKADGTDLVIPVSISCARVEQTPGALLPGYWSRHERSGPSGEDGPVPVFSRSRYGDIIGLPEKVEPGDTLIVSSLVLQAAADRIRGMEDQKSSSRQDPAQWYWGPEDESRLAVLRSLVAPGTGPADEAVRDEQGRIVAATRLISV
jgi:hypothetical protein